jgi:hypothetical protein
LGSSTGGTPLRRDFTDLGAPNYYRLCTDSFWMSGTTVRGRRYMKLFVYWPIAVHPEPRRALLISGAQFLAGTEELRELTRHALPLVDNFPQRLSTRVDRDWLQAESDAHYALVDLEANRRGFERSALVRRLWPPGLRERSLAQFETRRIIDQEVTWVPPSTKGLDELDEILTQTSLETLPLWMLRSSVHRQAVATALAAHGPAPGLAYWEGLGSLATRAYDEAASAFARARAEGSGKPGVVQMHALALGLGGRTDGLAAFANKHLNEETHRPFRRWLEVRFASAFRGSIPREE